MEEKRMTNTEVIELIKLKDMQFHNLYLQVHDNSKKIKQIAEMIESIAKILKEERGKDGDTHQGHKASDNTNKRNTSKSQKIIKDDNK